jgi:lipopolysaccharide/colanic/teichoic acid biosynthesis glycosyltransferase
MTNSRPVRQDNSAIDFPPVAFRSSSGLYERFFKRPLDIVFALSALIVFSWLYLLLALLVRVKMGSPVVFKQPRPGLVDPQTGHERIFALRKFRTMTNATDADGNLLPDDQRLTRFGKMLRATSLDELPEVFNILKGDMSIIGPRPQLVRDMVFMSPRQRLRHTVRPGLSGLAQVMGRNGISWNQKLDFDLQYIQHISFLSDLRIIATTVKQVFFRSNLTQSSSEIDITLDFGDQLLRDGRIAPSQYQRLQEFAREILAGRQRV